MTTAEFVECKSLGAGALIDVETKNRHYQIECLGGNRIRVWGHPEICPVPTAASLQGSADKQGVLEPGLIARGRYLRLLLDDRRPVQTSRVVSIHVDRSQAAQPVSSSVH